MPDPTKKPRDFHDWVLWRERRGPFAAPRDELWREAIADIVGEIKPADLLGPVAVLQAAGAELYRLSLDPGQGIIEITGAVEPAGLLGAAPRVLSREVLRLGRLVLIDTTERDGAWVKKDVVLRPRFHLEQYGALRFGLGAGQFWQYGALCFRLTAPAKFKKYLADPQYRSRLNLELDELVAFLLGHEVFQRHRNEKLSPPLRLVKQEAQDRYPDFDIPRDNLLRKVVKDERVKEVYGQPRGRGHHLRDWERALLNR